MTNSVRVLWALTAPAAILAGCGGIDDRDIEFISMREVRPLHHSLAESPRDALFIDARAPKYFAEGHIPGAVNFQLPEFPEKAAVRESVEAYDQKIVYGDNPGSPEATGMTKRLMANGYSGVKLFAGGLEEWAQAGLPVEKGEAPKPAR